MAFRVLVINFGSTSSKLSFYKKDLEENAVVVQHSRSEINLYRNIAEQIPMRKKIVFDFFKKSDLCPENLSAIAVRAGALPPLEAGGYLVNQAMIERLTKNPVADHAANLCAIIAFEIFQPLGIPVYIYDSGVIDQMEEIAKISGIPEVQRKSMGHLENMRAAAFFTARKLNEDYHDLNLVVCHMGGGITLSIHNKGRMIDIITDENGPFAPERSGSLPCYDLVNLCFSGKYQKEELLKLIRGKGGLYAYLGTTDALEIEKRISENDKNAELIYQAMAYQVAKAIGELATVVDGYVHRIVLTGGLARSKIFTGWVRKRVRFIAPVEIVPGEREMESLALGVLRILEGKEVAHQYV